MFVVGVNDIGVYEFNRGFVELGQQEQSFKELPTRHATLWKLLLERVTAGPIAARTQSVMANREHITTSARCLWELIFTGLPGFGRPTAFMLLAFRS